MYPFIRDLSPKDIKPDVEKNDEKKYDVTIPVEEKEPVKSTIVTIEGMVNEQNAVKTTTVDIKPSPRVTCCDCVRITLVLTVIILLMVLCVISGVPTTGLF